MKRILHINHFLIFISILTLVSCKNSSYIFKNADKKIELVIPNNQIILEDSISTTYATLKLTNIKPNELTVIGVGTSILKNLTNQDMQLIIRTRANYFEQHNTYKLKVSYKENSKKIEHIFEIPLKK